jgi:periplasmic protein TonB
MMGLAPEDIADLRRWAFCGAVIVLAHGGIAAAMVNWQDPDDVAEPAAAIVIDFAPVPVAPAIPPTELPPGPEQVVSDESHNKPVESVEEKPEEKIEQKVQAKLEQKVEEKVETKPLEEPPPEVAPAPNPEVAVQPPPPQEIQQETPKRQEPRPPAPATTAPQAIPDQVAALPAAPTQGKQNPDASKTRQTWKMQVFTILKRTIRYPEVANRRGQTGTVYVYFILDRQGHLLDSRVIRSSGVAALDEEALALLRRAQPFPPPPPEEPGNPDMPGNPVPLNVPVNFQSDAKR